MDFLRIGKTKMNFQALAVGLCLLIVGQSVFAEEEIPFDLNATQQEDQNYENAMQSATPQKIKEAAQVPLTKTKEKEVHGLTGLGRLSSFNDIAVISRRFLPKTGRFEVSPNLGMVINDAFFTDFSYGARIAYYFSEKYSAEFTGLWVTSSSKAVTSELAALAITATAFATPVSFYGLDFKWSPLYGKMGWLNKSIVPFDIYFTIGGGVTNTNQNTSPGTAHVGFGQLYAINKWAAVRLDLSWYGYQSTSQVASTGTNSTGSYSNIYATVGASFFFPEAEYR